MNFKELVERRHSVRSFSQTPIEPDKLQAVLEAGRVSPTACNLQPQRIFVLRSTEALAKIRVCTSCHFNAPLVLLICYDQTETWKRSFDQLDSGMIDASIVTTQMMLAATEQGLGTTWVCYFDPVKLVQEFSLPEQLVPVALLPMGYSAETSKPHPNHLIRKPMQDTVSFL
ncbi:MAG: nitroreductase family protein [Lentisphaeria bacterium]